MQDENLENERRELIPIIEGSNEIVLLSHLNPDRDAVGSVLGMYWILKKMGKSNVKMVLETPHNVHKGFLEGQDQIIFDKLENQVTKTTDLIILLDQNNWGISTEFSRKDTKAKVVVIDHHNTDLSAECDLYIRSIISSCCEIIFELFHPVVEIDERIAKPLLMGMYDDTGGFGYRGVSPRTLAVASKLVKTGVDISEISEESKIISEKVFLGGKTLFDNFVGLKDKKYFYTYLSSETVKEYKLEYIDIEGMKEAFMKTLLNIEEYTWGFFVKPKADGTCSITFRSKNDGPIVRILAEALGGGGHDKAAGAISKNPNPFVGVKLVEKTIEEIDFSAKG